jgi:two-component system CheB/CheR fusion protein
METTQEGQGERGLGREPTHVVGIGASAGGLEALEHLFRGMPADTGMAFVVVQHLSPDFKSQMEELLSRWTELDVTVAEHGERVQADTVYLMPSNTEMIISDGKLLLQERSGGLTMPIDQFLRSLAGDQRERSIGVILSGTGTDGSRGVREVRDAGGLVIVQTEDSAKFDGMPRSAIDTGSADLILRPEDVPRALVEHATRSTRAAHGSSEALREGGMQAVFQLLRERFQIDFASYKPSTIARRVERRLQLDGSGSLNSYLERLARDATELDALYRDLLIGVTSFFRDAQAYRVLAEDILPELVAKVPRGSELRIWAAGCATGEEAYSLAMLVAEEIERKRRPVTVKIFATDAHGPSLDFASAGVYPEERLEGVSPERLRRHFVHVEGGLKVSADLRQIVVFARHNVMRDAPFTKMDLVTCRNLLIYLQPAVQRKVVALFHFALKTGGVLFLGPSESPGDVEDEFEPLDQHWKIYRKRRDVRLLSALRGPPAPTDPRRPSPVGREDPVLFEVFAGMLDESLPPSILLDRKHEIVHTFGDVSSILRVPRGRPSLALLDMLDGDLKLAVAGALHRAQRSPTPITFSGLRIETPSGERLVDLKVRPLTAGRSSTYFLVSLGTTEAPPKSAPEHALDLDAVSRDRLTMLENELRLAKENLQATIEELEASNEELQATNEELLASNQELQSTNEELHSVNEELYTVNAEYQRKIDELTELTDDVSNLLLSTEVHTLFLDDGLRIRKFTPKMAEVFHLVERDVGRRIDNFVHTIEVEGLHEKLELVQKSGERVEMEVTTRRGQAYLMRILPYRGRIGGVVLTLTDVTTLKEWERALEHQLAQRERFLAMLSHELRNPLAGVLNAMTLLRRRAGGTRGLDEPLSIAERQVTQMAHLLDDLLDVSRMTLGKIHLRRARLDMREVASEALETMRQTHEPGAVEVSLEKPGQPVWVEGDRTRLLQVVENLLSNAWKYTPAGGRIALRLSIEGGLARIEVEDSGQGIAADALPHIFDMFVQGDDTLDRARGGLGVGLTLVRQLVELHGGSVRAVSDGPTRGSLFVVELPLAEPAVNVESAPEPTRANRRTPRHLVLVEDQDDIREPLALLLEDDGFVVQTARNGMAGLELILAARPEVALLDLGLPDLDGFELGRRVRESFGPEGIRLVALTGYGSEEDRQKTTAAGFDAHIVKPVMPEDVVGVLQQLEAPRRAEA